MHKIYELKEMLCDELEKYGSKELTAGSLDVVDKLAHTIKNLDKILESSDEEYSGRSYAMDRGNGTMMHGGRSYARGRGRYAKRDSMGRYSSANADVAEELRELMHDTDPQTQQDIQRIINRLESM